MDDYLSTVRLARRGDADAFAALYAEIYEDLYRFAYYMLKHTADAQDVVSDTVTDAFAQIGKLREDASFRSWIFCILANKCRRRQREYVKRRKLMDTVDGEDVAAWEPDRAEALWVRSLFQKLPKKDQMILALHLFAGYSSKETGALLHMNENTVRSRASRALKRLGEQMRTQ